MARSRRRSGDWRSTGTTASASRNCPPTKKAIANTCAQRTASQTSLMRGSVLDVVQCRGHGGEVSGRQGLLDQRKQLSLLEPDVGGELDAESAQRGDRGSGVESEPVE